MNIENMKYREICEYYRMEFLDEWSEMYFLNAIKYVNADELPHYNMCNENITWKTVINNPTFCWVPAQLASNKNITYEIVKNNPSANERLNNAVLDLLEQKVLDLLEQIKSDRRPKIYYIDGSDSKLTLDDIIAEERKLNKDINYRHLSCSYEVTWEMIKANPQIPWDYKYVSMNPNIVWDAVVANPDEAWDYSWLSVNDNITWEIICSNPEKPWDYESISALNQNISWEIFNNDVKKRLDPNCMLYNSMRIIRNKKLDEYMRRKLSDWFRRSDLKAELMANVWNPKNFHKFKYLDPEEFGEM